MQSRSPEWQSLLWPHSTVFQGAKISSLDCKICAPCKKLVPIQFWQPQPTCAICLGQLPKHRAKPFSELQPHRGNISEGWKQWSLSSAVAFGPSGHFVTDVAEVCCNFRALLEGTKLFSNHKISRSGKLKLVSTHLMINILLLPYLWLQTSLSIGRMTWTWVPVKWS